MTFELDDGLYRITKRFIKKPYARLSCPDGRKLEGDAAEDELRDLLGFGKPGRTGAKPEMLGMWNVLWVRQGQSFHELDLPESARANLHSALESEVGAVLGGRRGRDLPRVVKEQLDKLVTIKGKPRCLHKEFLEQAEELRNEIENLRERRQRLSQVLGSLEDDQEELKRLDSGDGNRKNRVELDEARQQHSQRSDLETRIETASKDLELKRLALERAEQATETRHKQTEEIKTEEGSLEKARKRFLEMRQHEQDMRSRLDELRGDLHRAGEVSGDADQTLSRNQRVLTMVERQARICELEKAVAAEERGNEVSLKAEAIRATDETIEAARRAKQRLDTANSRRDAAATRISFDMADENMSGIKVDGRPLTDDRRPVRAVEPVTITIPERGRITIEPAIKNSEVLLRRRREAKAVFERALDEAGAVTIEDAENQLSERKGLLRDAEFARKEVVLHAPETKEQEGEVRTLAARLEGLRRDLTREMKEFDLQYLPTRSEAEMALRSAKERADEAQRACRTARAEMDGPEKELHRRQVELGKAEILYKNKDAHLGNLRCRLQAAEEKHSNEKLQNAIKVERAAHGEAEAAVARLEAQRTGETLEQLRARIDRLEEAIKVRSDKRTDLREKIARLKSRVEIADGDGLDEAIKKKERELELRDEECGRLSRETQVLDLLHSTLRSAEREAKGRYLSPVLKRVHRYLRHLFPCSDIKVDENFRIDGVVREAGHEEPFRQLSMGTQEQIAVLVRLAFAEMLLEKDHPASVVLDDALVFQMTSEWAACLTF